MMAPIERLPPKNEKNEKYKTELCKNWQNYNECLYGDKCQFAHV